MNESFVSKGAYSQKEENDDLQQKLLPLLQQVLARQLLRMEKLLYMVRRSFLSFDKLIADLKVKLVDLLEVKNVIIYLAEAEHLGFFDPVSEVEKGKEGVIDLSTIYPALLRKAVERKERFFIKRPPSEWGYAFDERLIVPLPPNDAVNSNIITVVMVREEELFGLIVIEGFLGSFSRSHIEWIELVCEFVTTMIYSRLQYEKLREFSIKDGLTGLYNHRYFYEILSNFIEQHIRYKKPLSVAMLDIDDFKKVNDVYGHLVGDKVLEGIAQIITNNIRSSDIAARYGGEEFAIILPETKAEDAYKVCERIRQKIMESEFVLRDTKCKVTVSIGVVGLMEEEIIDVATLVDRADSALYIAKRSGKNRVVLWNQTVEVL